MEARIDLLSLVLILGSAQSLFLACVFWRADRGNRRANRLLAAFFMILPLATMNGILYRTGIYRSAAFLIGLEPAFRLLMGPVLFLYVERLVSPTVPLRTSLPRHLGGALLLMPLCLPFYLADPVFKMLFIEVWLRNGSYTAAEYFGRFWYEIAFELQLWIYLGVIWVKVRRYELMIRDTYSSIDSITLSWMRKVLIAFALALAGGTVSYVLFFLVISFRSMYLFAPLAAVFSAYYIGYKAFHQPDVFLLAKPALRPEPVAELRRKYEKSGISEEDGELLLRRLDRVVLSKRPYADPDLTLPKLAALLQASPHHLSQLLNQRLGTSFYDYVNRLRVEEVKRCLSDPAKAEESVLDIALECGFNSKSAFNRIFKQHTTLSPTQFRLRSAGVQVDA
ncbi:MAG TPA: helix-turn-helix domain-containing protein [Rectinemataceae bacterium]|nr:helix-turn-helix domain-containing protein [Rectinemataceae bacterium]